MKSTREEKLSDAFLELGSQYYVHARYSVENHYLPVSITLLHHAIEMLLKGYMVRRITPKELKRKFGHDLVKIWDSFKAMVGDNSLNHYDMAVSRLNEVESLRYPVKMVDEGFYLSVIWGPVIPTHLAGTEQLKQYSIDVHEVDDIAFAIFKACEVDAKLYFRNAPSELKKWLPHKFRSPEILLP